MSYPQPLAQVAVASGLGYFRLNTPLVSDGDMYESTVGCHALAIGPESDIAKINVAYWDDTQPGNMNIAIVDPAHPFIGAIFAHNEKGAVYSAAGMTTMVPGRILIWPFELFNPVTPAPPIGGRVDIITPVLDIIQYFAPPSGLPTQRNDKTFQFQDFPWPAAGVNYQLVVPFYGRRYAAIEFLNHGDQDISVVISGLNYYYTSSNDGAMRTILRVPTVVAPDGRLTEIISALTDGMYDTLLFEFDAAATPALGSETPLKIAVSDLMP